MDFLTLGKVIDSFSLDGTLKVLSKTNLKEKRYKNGNVVFLFDTKNNTREKVTIEKYRSSGEIDFIKIKEINSIEEAILKRNFLLQVEKNSEILEDGQYFYCDLEQCDVLNEKEVKIGKVICVEEFPAQTTLRCQSLKNKIFFVPFISEFILNVDIEKKTIKIKVIEGLLWK